MGVVCLPTQRILCVLRGLDDGAAAGWSPPSRPEADAGFHHCPPPWGLPSCVGAGLGARSQWPRPARWGT